VERGGGGMGARVTETRPAVKLRFEECRQMKVRRVQTAHQVSPQ